MVYLFEIGIVVFLCASWAFEKIIGALKGSPLVGNILAGILFGPALFNVVYAPASWKLIGRVGLYLLLVDGTLSIDLDRVKRLGVRAFFAAFTGVLGPVLLSLVVVRGIFKRPWMDTLATGAALAPTSLGFSTTLLAEFGQLQTDIGQLICVTAVMDDTISLMLMAELAAVSGGMSAWVVAKPIVASMGSLLVGWVLADVVFPMILPKVLTWLPSQENPVPVRWWCIMIMMLAVPSILACACTFAGASDLLGIICGTLPFTRFPEALDVWHNCKAMKVSVEWGTRLFFGCTVGFSVPKLGMAVGGMFYLRSFAAGWLYFLVAYLGKSFLCFYTIPLNYFSMLKYTFGMQGRGEFSFVILAEATSLGVLGVADTASVTWALLLTNFVTPGLFRLVLQFSPTESVRGDAKETDALCKDKIIAEHFSAQV